MKIVPSARTRGKQRRRLHVGEESVHVIRGELESPRALASLLLAGGQGKARMRRIQR
jgi:hypothetical protein